RLSRTTYFLRTIFASTSPPPRTPPFPYTTLFRSDQPHEKIELAANHIARPHGPRRLRRVGVENVQRVAHSRRRLFGGAAVRVGAQCDSPPVRSSRAAGQIGRASCRERAESVAAATCWRRWCGGSKWSG